MTYDEFRDFWAEKPRKAVERELSSWRKYMDRHSSAYAWHGRGITPPGDLADGDKVSALREALDIIDARSGDAMGGGGA